MAKVNMVLIDATNLLDEAINLIEAGFMASSDVADPQQRDALRGVLEKAGDIARSSSKMLSDEIVRLREAPDV